MLYAYMLYAAYRKIVISYYIYNLHKTYVLVFFLNGQTSSMHNQREQNRQTGALDRTKSTTRRSVNQLPPATVAISQVMKFTPPVPKCPRHIFAVLAVCSCTKVVQDMEHDRPENPCDIFRHMSIV